ncbi:protein of unknown function [Oceanospirillum multiglobuliferum]|uniref:DUF4156 domain-containing protein n=1 Tax=Oceanospirillum multiglobuliferum TaxID=64969 RepID=A0A1T4S6Q7_9GAMM|nr:DUF4156 domain-containing protein [Oceanospirillum multiglobuliferum]OPX54424.1 hypothetical protein BTE48_14435 [Oceanospirillum multiglobuliferum]SKA23944.1 protein of unknown function [Oceanospirillum multiglobuliferum]
MKCYRVLKTAVISLSLVLISACNWVKPVEGSDQVNLVQASNLTGCQKLGHTTSFVKDQVAGLARNQKTVTEELVTLGKNQAVEMGGDSIVQTSELKEGKMEFEIFRCKR